MSQEIKPKIIAITGGSGSGKTTLARNLREYLGPQQCIILSQDSYYYDHSEDFDHDGGSVNFDHPKAIEFSLLKEQLQYLKNGMSVEVPIYDFVSHARLEETKHIEPHPIIIVDGILVLSQSELLDSYDLKIFIDADEETRFQRRLKRDVEERGRTPEGVKEQFFKQVKPMHDEYVETSKYSADLVISGLEDKQFILDKALEFVKHKFEL